MTALVIPDFGQQTGEHYDENQRTAIHLRHHNVKNNKLDILKPTTLNCAAKHKANER